MKNIIKLFLVAVAFALSCFASNGQEIRFKAYRGSDGVPSKGLDGVFAWGPWTGRTADILIDLTNEKVDIDDRTLEILEKPKKWIIKKDLKYVSFACTDETLNKFNVKLYQYDKGEFRIYVMEEKTAVRYSVQYLD